MKNKFKQNEVNDIENKISEIERITGIELRVALLKQSDPYPGAIHRYCFVVSIIILFIVDIFFYLTATQMLLATLVTYGVLFLTHPFSFFTNLFITNLFITNEEKSREVKEKAFELFYLNGLNQTVDQIGMIILISFTERKMEIITDRGLKNYLMKSDLDEMINLMRNEFKKRDYARGVLESLNILETKLTHKLEKRVKSDHLNELSNKIIWD